MVSLLSMLLTIRLLLALSPTYLYRLLSCRLSVNWTVIHNPPPPHTHTYRPMSLNYFYAHYPPRESGATSSQFLLEGGHTGPGKCSQHINKWVGDRFAVRASAVNCLNVAFHSLLCVRFKYCIQLYRPNRTYSLIQCVIQRGRGISLPWINPPPNLHYKKFWGGGACT